jgi:acyl-coenzyme A synthetase/AMP-(fatty) acid ligase
MSPRNISAAIIKMLKEVDCHKLLTTRETLKSLVSEIKADLARDSPGFELEVLEMPPVLEIYPKLGKETAQDPFEPYPKPAVRPDANDAVLYLHSSGSTGFPKSIKETYKILAQWASFRKLSCSHSILESKLTHDFSAHA